MKKRPDRLTSRSGRIYRLLLLFCAVYFLAVSVAHQLGEKIPLLFVFYDIPSERYQDLIISFLSFGWAMLFIIGFLDQEMRLRIQVPVLISGIAAISGLIRARMEIEFHPEITYEILGLAILLFLILTTFLSALLKKK